MLAVRPWSAYELTKQMRRSLAYCWPKAESVLYAEPKRLVKLGLASARDEPAGRGGRTRAVYRITDAGRASLREWLATEPAPPRFELEPMLRLLFADQGDRQDLLASVAATHAWALVEAERGLAQLEGYRRDGGPFPERLHIVVPFADLYVRLVDVVEGWAADTRARVGAWPHTRDLGATPDTAEHLDALIERARQVTGRAAEAARSATG